MPFDSSSGLTIEADPSPAELIKKSRRRRQRCKSSASVSLADCQHSPAIQSISEMIQQIQRCEKILAEGLADGSDSGDSGASSQQQQQLSDRLLSKVKQLDSLHRTRCNERRKGHSTSLGLDRNNNKCCNGATSSNAVPPDEGPIGMQFESTESANFGGEEGYGAASPSGSPGGQTQAYPKHQDYCLCHKRKCQRCGCLCPCTEHACPSCGYTSRVVMTMRAVDGLKAIANAQKARYRNGRMALASRCKSSKRKRFLLSESSECSHAVMVRVGGGFVPLVEYLKSHNKVVLSKFTRGDGSAFLSPWRPYYPGPLRKGRPRGIRYVDSVTQQLEEIIFANKEAGKSHCICP